LIQSLRPLDVILLDSDSEKDIINNNNITTDIITEVELQNFKKLSHTSV
jgi:hypothetical protein